MPVTVSDNSRKSSVVGASPDGATDPQSAALAVREMFTSIAPRYDFLNHVLSFNIDRIWWWRTARSFAYILGKPNTRVLDICCGTGDLTLALLRKSARADAQIIGADFAHPMLQRAMAKSKRRRVQWLEADALQLPFADAQFNLVTSAFGFRNLANYDKGLEEIARILQPEGEVGILDFGEPGGWLGNLYRLYFKHVLPRVGTLISGVKGPYSYLPASVERFPSPAEMLERMKRVGFAEVSWTPYTFGVAGLYRGRKSTRGKKIEG